MSKTDTRGTVWLDASDDSPVKPQPETLEEIISRIRVNRRDRTVGVE